MNANACIAIAIFALSFVFPDLKVFYTLQYKHNNLYTMGPLDILIAIYFTNFWLLVRSLFMTIKFNIGNKEQRFKEQLYQAIMYIVTFSYGMFNYLQSDYKNDWMKMVQDYPHALVTKHVKLYFMLILSMWIHMVFLLYLEKRRKDHNMMLMHHFVTITLITLSWFTSMTKIGLLIEVVFDSTDILLCVAKCVKYTKRHVLADLIFGAFVLNWVYTRQYLFGNIIWILLQFPKFNDLKWDPSNGYFFDSTFYYSSIILLCTLFLLAMLWFAMIIKLVFKVLHGNNVEDSRSDDEEEETGGGDDKKHK